MCGEVHEILRMKKDVRCLRWYKLVEVPFYSTHDCIGELAKERKSILSSWNFYLYELSHLCTYSWFCTLGVVCSWLCAFCCEYPTIRQQDYKAHPDSDVF